MRIYEKGSIFAVKFIDMNKDKDIATKFAQDNRFDTAIRSGKKWKGNLLYVAVFNPDPDGNPPYTGYPQFIIIEANKPRFATSDEIFKIMGITPMPIGFTERFEDYL